MLIALKPNTWGNVNFIMKYVREKIIYILFDPNSGDPKYVGQSIQGVRRIFPHIHKNELSHNTKKVNWIKSLLDEDKIYHYMILEKVETQEQLDRQEEFWIKYFKNLDVPIKTYKNTQ